MTSPCLKIRDSRVVNKTAFVCCNSTKCSPEDLARHGLTEFTVFRQHSVNIKEKYFIVYVSESVVAFYEY